MYIIIPLTDNKLKTFIDICVFNISVTTFPVIIYNNPKNTILGIIQLSQLSFINSKVLTILSQGLYDFKYKVSGNALRITKANKYNKEFIFPTSFPNGSITNDNNKLAI